MKRKINKDNLQAFIDLNNSKEPKQNNDWRGSTKKEFYEKFVTWRMYDLKNFKDNKIVFKNINKDIKKNYDNQWKWFEDKLKQQIDRVNKEVIGEDEPLDSLMVIKEVQIEEIKQHNFSSASRQVGRNELRWEQRQKLEKISKEGGEQ